MANIHGHTYNAIHVVQRDTSGFVVLIADQATNSVNFDQDVLAIQLATKFSVHSNRQES